MQTLVQLTIDTLAYFIGPFAVVVVMSWLVSLFRYK